MKVRHTKVINLIDFEEHIASIVLPDELYGRGARRVRDEATHVFWEGFPGNDCYINAHWEYDLAMQHCNDLQKLIITELSKLGVVEGFEEIDGLSYPKLENFLWEISW